VIREMEEGGRRIAVTSREWRESDCVGLDSGSEHDNMRGGWSSQASYMRRGIGKIKAI
jgi:hypothetical protein